MTTSHLRRYLGLAMVIVIVALVTQTTWESESTEADVSRPTAIRIRGVNLGMSRAQVDALHGPPLSEKVDDIYPGSFTVAKYNDNGVFGDPQITYDSSGRVVEVSGQSLEWDNGHFTEKTPESEILKTFPKPDDYSRAVYHPWFPGRCVYPEKDLVIETGTESMFGGTYFLRATLGVPFIFPLDSYWRHSDSGNLLSVTGRMSGGPNRKQLLESEVVGCFFCVELISERPVFHDGKTGACPKCNSNSLLAGTREEISVEFLEEVHAAWLNPYSEGAAKTRLKRSTDDAEKSAVESGRP